MAEIEALKRKAHESQYEVSSLTIEVKISNNHQKLTVKALKKANLELIGLKD